MIYRVATPEDWPAVEECIASTGYYFPVDASTLGGIIVVAERERDHKIVGCLWAMVGGRHAYLDYLSTHREHHGVVALWLGVYMEKVLRNLGVRWVRSVVKTDNRPAQRIAEANGMVGDPGYSLYFKELHGSTDLTEANRTK